jgi:multisubunit Na+/H+ antiporter MnhE subunit
MTGESSVHQQKISSCCRRKGGDDIKERNANTIQMTNIFNLFLFLFLAWVSCMLISDNISWFFIISGIIASGLVALVSFKLNIVTKESEFLYFNFGFYNHFLGIYLKNFFTFPFFLVNLAFNSNVRPLVYTFPLENISKAQIAILVASFNMSCGLLFIDSKDKKLLIHSVNKEYFEKINLSKLSCGLSKINDESLI